MFDQYANKLIVNATTLLSTLGLSVMSLADILSGFLPTISLLITTFTTGVLAFYWVAKLRRENLEIKRLERDLGARNDDL